MLRQLTFRRQPIARPEPTEIDCLAQRGSNLQVRRPVVGPVELRQRDHGRSLPYSSGQVASCHTESTREVVGDG